jgi:hypothetical protein
MFGGMGGMGGGRNSSLRFIRLGALAALLIGTAVFRVHGTGYVTLRIIYFAVIAAVIVYSVTMRHRGGSGRPGPGPGGPPDANDSPDSVSGRGGFGTPPPHPAPPPPSGPPASWPPRPPGGFPDNPDPESES